MFSPTTLEKIRKVSLWTALIGSALSLILILLWIWGAINPFNLESVYFGGSVFTGWGKLLFTVSTVANTAFTILLVLLISSHVKKEKD